MPIKDKEKAREYFKNYMANRRKGLTVKPEKSLTNQNVKPKAEVLNLELVKPNSVKPENMLNLVKPSEDIFVKPVKSLENVKPIIENVKPSFSPNLSSSEIVLEKVKELLLVYSKDKEADKVIKAKDITKNY